MDDPDPPDLFAGDWGDPWVVAIGQSMPRRTVVLDLPGDCPDAWPESALSARVVVLHRQTFSSHDAERLKRLKARGGDPPRIVLCLGPHVRASDLDRWGGLAEVVLHEATASEVLARHVEPWSRPASPLKVAVLGGGFESRKMLAEGCDSIGYPAQVARDWCEPEGVDFVLWDVPVLEEVWDRELARESKLRRVVALLGFADRASVTKAKQAGASACLELPCDLADLAFVLDRLSRTPRNHPPHAVPPAPMGLRSSFGGGRRMARDLK